MNFKSQILILSFAFAILNHSNDRKLYKRKLEKQGKDGQSRPWSRNGSRGSISDPENDIQTAPLGDDGHWTRWMANRNSPEGSEGSLGHTPVHDTAQEMLLQESLHTGFGFDSVTEGDLMDETSFAGSTSLGTENQQRQRLRPANVGIVGMEVDISRIPTPQSLNRPNVTTLRTRAISTTTLRT